MKIKKIEHTPNPAARKFILNGRVAATATLAFQKGDTGKHPLADALFELGATNILLCQDFVSVALAAPEDWETLEGEVRSTIVRHLAEPAADDAPAGPGVRLRVIDTEKGGDPATLKFILVAPVFESGTRSFNIEEDEATPDRLAQALFRLGATDIELSGNTVSVTMFSDRAWEHFLNDVQAAIEEHLNPGKQEAAAPPSILDAIDKERFPGLPREEKLKLIESLLDELVRPALANDGGGLELVDLQDHTVKIKYQGACGTCPSSVSGTLRAIDRCLKGYLDPRLEVISI